MIIVNLLAEIIRKISLISKSFLGVCVLVFYVCVCLNRSFYPKTYAWKGKLHASKASLIIEF